jgi:hypothetical protein
MDLLQVLSKLVAGQTYFRITPGFLLRVYENHPGVDRSATIAFEKGIDLVEGSTRNVHAQGLMTRALVRGTKADESILFQQAFTGPDTAPLEAQYGRIEGYVEYKHAATTGRLTKAGNQAIAQAKLRAEGPTTAGVDELAGQMPYDDFVAGDIVSYDDGAGPQDLRVSAIVLSEAEDGGADLALEWNEQPYDPSGGTEFGTSQPPAAGGGPGGGGTGCNDCPTLGPTPFDPGQAGIGEFDAGVGSTSFGFPAEPDNQTDWFTEHAGSLIALEQGAQYRVVFVQTSSFGAGDPNDPNYFNFMATANLRLQPGTEGGGAGAGNFLDPDTMAVSNIYPLEVAGPWTVGKVYESPWRIWDGTDGALHDFGIGGTALSGYWGYRWEGDLRLEKRGGADGDEEAVPVTGQPIIESVGSDGTTDPGSPTTYPYAPLSLEVWVNGVDMTLDIIELDPEAGTYEFVDAIPAGSTIRRKYLSAGGAAL